MYTYMCICRCVYNMRQHVCYESSVQSCNRTTGQVDARICVGNFKTCTQHTYAHARPRTYQHAPQHTCDLDCRSEDVYVTRVLNHETVKLYGQNVSLNVCGYADACVYTSMSAL